MRQLHQVIAAIASGQMLDQRYKDHPLKGAYGGFRECHVAPDWLLVYLITENEPGLARTGSHAALFE